MRTFLTNALAAGPNIRVGMEQEQERQRSRIQTQAAQLGLDESQFRFDELQQMQPYRYRQTVAGVESAEAAAQRASLDLDLQQRFGERDRELSQQSVEANIRQSEANVREIEHRLHVAKQQAPYQVEALRQQLATARMTLQDAIEAREREAAIREDLPGLFERSIGGAGGFGDQFLPYQPPPVPPVPATSPTQRDRAADRRDRDESQRQRDAVRDRRSSAAPTEGGRPDEVAGLISPAGRRAMSGDMSQTEFLGMIGADDSSRYMAGGVSSEQTDRVSEAELRRRGQLIEILARSPSEPLQMRDDESPQDFKKRENRYNSLVQKTHDSIKIQLNRLNPDRLSDNQIRDMGFQSREQLKQVVSLFNSDDFRDFLAERPRLLMELDRNYEASSFDWLTAPVRTGQVPIGDLLQIAGAIPSGTGRSDIPRVADPERRDAAIERGQAEAQTRQERTRQIVEALRQQDPDVTQETIDRVVRTGSPTRRTIAETALDENNTFFANPELITPEMTALMDHREALVSAGEFLARHGSSESVTELMNLASQIRQTDVALTGLMGRQATLEFHQYNDPRRMDGVWGYLNNAQIQTIPRTDGLWNQTVNGVMRLEGVTAEYLTNQFTMTYSASAREAFAAEQAELAKSGRRMAEKRSEIFAQLEADIIKARTLEDINRVLRGSRNVNVMASIESPGDGRPSHYISVIEPGETVPRVYAVVPGYDSGGINVPARIEPITDMSSLR